MVLKQGGFALEFSGGENDPLLPLHLILQDCEELLTSDDLSRLRICAAEECGWLFLDRSKNGTRRWCDMADCGNLDKQRRHYRKKRK
ncbi:MAG: hypothetical protein DCC75_03515 [Proteobacteria bacterium]|nr:MAG: hypothetical protein DCC75_03515 [Pseudomonadota bacterium]